jgi:hypothetical protein
MNANLLSNLAVSDAAAHDPHDPLLNIFHLDVHMRGALFEGQNGLRKHQNHRDGAKQRHCTGRYLA